MQEANPLSPTRLERRHLRAIQKCEAGHAANEMARSCSQRNKVLSLSSIKECLQSGSMVSSYARLHCRHVLIPEKLIVYQEQQNAHLKEIEVG